MTLLVGYIGNMSNSNIIQEHKQYIEQYIETSVLRV